MYLTESQELVGARMHAGKSEPNHLNDFNTTSHVEATVLKNKTGKNSEPQSTVPSKEYCRVCGDLASGVHFGVFSCEGCKGFFKRSQHVDAQSGLPEFYQYRCLNQSQCVVTATTRNGCRYCRFATCIYVGMSKQAIKLGRRCKKVKKKDAAARGKTRQKEAVKLEAAADAGACCGPNQQHPCHFQLPKMTPMADDLNNRGAMNYFLPTSTCAPTPMPIQAVHPQNSSQSIPSTSMPAFTGPRVSSITPTLTTQLIMEPQSYLKPLPHQDPTRVLYPWSTPQKSYLQIPSFVNYNYSNCAYIPSTSYQPAFMAQHANAGIKTGHSNSPYILPMS